MKTLAELDVYKRQHLYRTTPMSARKIAKQTGVSVRGFYDLSLIHIYEGGNLSGMASRKRQQQQQERRHEMKRIYTVMEYVPLLLSLIHI